MCVFLMSAGKSLEVSAMVFTVLTSDVQSCVSIFLCLFKHVPASVLVTSPVETENMVSEREVESKPNLWLIVQLRREMNIILVKGFMWFFKD